MDGARVPRQQHNLKLMQKDHCNAAPASLPTSGSRTPPTTTADVSAVSTTVVPLTKQGFDDAETRGPRLIVSLPRDGFMCSCDLATARWFRLFRQRSDRGWNQAT